MPGFILHQGATVICAHGGHAQSTSPNPRVLVSGQPILMQPIPFVVAACPFVTAAGDPSPCLTAQWVMAATRVTSNGMPVLLNTSAAICTPNGTPLMILITQTKVSAV